MNDEILSRFKFQSFEAMTGTDSAIAISIVPAYAYVNNKKTEKIEAYNVDCVIPTLGFSKLRVKVSQKPDFQDEDFEKNNMGIPVHFDGFFARFYANSDELHITAKAEKCVMDEDADLFPDFQKWEQ